MTRCPMFGAYFIETILPFYVVGAVGLAAMTAYFNRKEIR